MQPCGYIKETFNDIEKANNDDIDTFWTDVRWIAGGLENYKLNIELCRGRWTKFMYSENCATF